ncbi:MAG: hypothetical protein E6Q34_10200 [Burkholderiaceae bacterium]|nr:MAG: hypothetical protein E6Q34_10200 [Burkholderiaceae bacterium]
MPTEIQDLDGFIQMVTLSIQANEAADNEQWAKAIELLQSALEHFSPEVEVKKPGIRSKMLQTIGHYYMLLDRPGEAEGYFAEATQSLMESAAFKALERQLAPHFDKPVSEFPYAVSELSLVNEPYDGLVIPDALPLLQHMVCFLRPYRINLHAWAYETISSMQEDLEESPHKYLPSYFSKAKIKRLQKPRKYASDEAVMFKGKDGFVYKLEAPGKLTKLGSAKTKSTRKPVSR